MEYFHRVGDLRIDYKSDGSYVTEADRQVEQTVRDLLLAERPLDACLGEETGERGSGRRRWILDGIDGTAVFLAGGKSWQTLIALEEDGLITVAVASVPAHSKVWWAVRGGGAHVGELQGEQLRSTRRICVNAAPDQLEASRIGIVPDYHLLAPMYRDMVDDLLQITRLTPWAVHAGLLVASGELISPSSWPAKSGITLPPRSSWKRPAVSSAARMAWATLPMGTPSTRKVRASMPRR